MRKEFGSAGAGASWKALGLKTLGAHSIEASKSVGAKGDAPKICGFVQPLHPC